jgi:putative ABC transport system ATP-binding protein
MALFDHSRPVFERAGAPLIACQNVEKVYDESGAPYRALKSVSFTITDGESVALIGPSGSGKSTLLHILGCLHTPTAGAYHIYGTRIEAMTQAQLTIIRRNYIGFVFQDFHLLRRSRVYDNVVMPLIYARVPFRERRARVLKTLDQLGIGHLADKMCDKLSGGERQRVAISRALVLGPKILMADEPTGNLDTNTGRQVFDIFGEINARGTTLIVVTHNLELAGRFQRRIHLRDGLIERDEGASRNESRPD